MENPEQEQPGLASTNETGTQDTPPQKSLCEMPPEVLMHIALALPCREFARMLQTSRYIHDTINTHWIWHKRFTTRFGQTILQPLVRSRTPTPPPDSTRSSQVLNTSTGNENPPGGPSAPSSPTTENTHDIHTEQGEEACEAMKPAISKGKNRKVDLRKTTEVSKEELVSLYKKYSRMILPAEDMDIVHMGDRYWKMIEYPSSHFGKLAELRSVWWMDVAVVFRGVPPGRYRIQWRLSVTSDAPVVNSEFRAVLFDKDENASTTSTIPEAIMFKPRTVQEFTEQTDSKVAKADRKPFRNLFKGFATLELPADLVVDEDYQNVFVQIRNHEGWKSGLYIDYVRLVDLDDPVRSKDRIALRTEDSGCNVDEPVNDEGEEYYPSSSNSWLGNALGVRPNLTNNDSGSSRRPGGARSRAFRHVARLSDASATSLSPTTSAPSSPHLSATKTGNNNDNQPSPGSWYKLFAFLVIYCMYISWTQ
ncbi:hypothetical protein BGZ74_005812 [Mortierella antarctica]|nr:hypothetical protein BGZ74_005812 [Mortierella antarctica]